MKTIIILGGGSNKSGLPIWVKERCNLAIKLFNKNYNIIVSSAGTYHHPNYLDKNGFPILESDLMANYLVKNGIPKNKIYKESTSYDTIGNIFYIKTTITDIRKWYDLIIITSELTLSC